MKILDKIQAPSDVRRLSREELSSLCAEIRETILRTVSKNGGHLASNLGVVELTVALHRVFSFPEDAVVFDVGHQAYAHKLLTGRRERFSTLRQGGGLSGFTSRTESVYDVMTAGHSGSSLSYAVGLAEANRIAGSEAYTVAVVGDGSFTNGMIYEALNNAAVHRLRLIIVLNDNEMSISRNVGALSNYFSLIRTSEAYFTFKMALKRGFSAIPCVGDGMISVARRIRDVMKRILITQNMFESMNLTYYGPVAGDNLERLETVLAEARSRSAENGAVVVYVNTRKGKGYPPAEEEPDRFHSTGPFVLTGASSAETSDVPGVPKRRTFTEAFSERLLREAERDGRICAVTAAMTDGCGLSAFRERYPERFFDAGIAEEHAVAFAGGLACRGLKPVVAIYSTFMQRAFDQVWHDVALQGSDVVFVLSHCGLVAGDGVTHQGIYDISLFSPVPGLRIYSPSTCAEFEASLSLALTERGSAIVRYPKGAEPDYPAEEFDEIDGGRVKRFGEGAPRLLLLTYGRISGNVYDAARTYTEKTGVPCAMAVLQRILPLRLEALQKMISAAERVLFVEEGIRSGGVGEALAARIAESYPGKRVYIRAIEEGFLPHDALPALFRRVGLDADSLLQWMEETGDTRREGCGRFLKESGAS